MSDINDLTAREADGSTPMALAELALLPIPDDMDLAELARLHTGLEALYSVLMDAEPDADSEAHEAWEEAREQVTDRLDEVLDRIDAAYRAKG